MYNKKVRAKKPVIFFMVKRILVSEDTLHLREKMMRVDDYSNVDFNTALFSANSNEYFWPDATHLTSDDIVNAREVEIYDPKVHTSIGLEKPTLVVSEFLTELQKATRLTMLRLDTFQPSDYDWRQIVKLIQLPRLKNLMLIGLRQRFPFDERTLEALRDNTSIVDLDLNCNYLAENQTPLVDIIEKNTTITDLHLVNNGFHDEDAFRIAKALESNRGLARLKLNGNFLSDASLDYFERSLARNTSLTDIALGRSTDVKECKRNRVLQRFHQWPLELTNWPGKGWVVELVLTFLLCCSHVETPEDICRVICQSWGNIIKTKRFDRYIQ